MITLNGGIGNYIYLENTSYSYFAGNNYLGLANHPVLVAETIRAIEEHGLNFAASRKTTGTSCLHLKLEKLLAEFKGHSDAVVFASGYMGNSILLKALHGDYSTIFVDSMAHPSILDGIPRDVSPEIYGHCNPGHLEQLLRKTKLRPVIVTDGIFALTGEIAPLKEIYALAKKYNALLIVDDAHATGVLGESGKGTPEHFGLAGAENIYQSETMSKALGAYGGFISSEYELIHDIRCNSAFYGASTALPPTVAAAGCASLSYLKLHPELRENLLLNVKMLRTGIREHNFDSIEGITPIIPLLFGDFHKAKELSDFLYENKIIAPAVDYPVKTGLFIVRITVSAEHNFEQIENLLYVLKKFRSHSN
jgi:7-keto-8-aminopelargonate synthetase-like enzyme